jgi:hypothetical protein
MAESENPGSVNTVMSLLPSLQSMDAFVRKLWPTQEYIHFPVPTKGRPSVKLKLKLKYFDTSAL